MLSRIQKKSKSISNPMNHPTGMRQLSTYEFHLEKDGKENESTVRPPGFCQLLTVFSVLPVGICHAALVPDGQGCPGSVHQ